MMFCFMNGDYFKVLAKLSLFEQCTQKVLILFFKMHFFTLDYIFIFILTSKLELNKWQKVFFLNEDGRSFKLSRQHLQKNLYHQENKNLYVSINYNFTCFSKQMIVVLFSTHKKNLIILTKKMYVLI